MKKALLFAFTIFVVMNMAQCGLAYYGLENIPYNIILQGNSIEEIVCQSALIFHGNGYWEDAEVFTAGCEILENQVEGGHSLIAAIVAVCRFDTADGIPREVGSECYPVRLLLSNQADGIYSIQSYLFPEDGRDRSESRELFSNPNLSLILDVNIRNELFQCARNNALEEAKKFIRAQTGAHVSGGWREVLKNGSNGKAREILERQEFWDYNYPCFEGFVIWHKVLYQLSVEEEYSYSGKLCFSIYDSSGKRTEHIVRIQNDNVVYLN